MHWDLVRRTLLMHVEWEIVVLSYLLQFRQIVDGAHSIYVDGNYINAIAADVSIITCYL